MSGGILQEFLVALAWEVDSRSAKQAQDTANAVAKTVEAADKRTTAATVHGTGKRIIETNREAGVRTKGAAVLIGEMKRRREAEEQTTKVVTKARKDETEATEKATKTSQLRVASFLTGLAAIATAATAAATTATFALTRISKGLEEVFWASKRTNASAGNLKAFQFAAEKLGASAGQAGSSIEALAERMRASPGYEKLLNDLGVATKQNGKVRDLTESMVDLGDAFAKMPMFQAKAYAEALGIDERTLMALRSGEFKKYVNEYREMLAKARLDPDKAAADSKAFMDVWRRMTSAVEIVAIKVQSAIVERFGGSLNKFSDWLLENADRISGAVLNIADTMLRLADRATDLFRAFDRLSPGTKDTIVQLLALGAALLVLKSGPLGVILALSAAILALYDDYRKWQEGSRDTLIDWGKWGPGLEKCLAFLTSETGLTAAFVALGAALTLKVLAPLGKVMGLLGTLGALRPPPWLLGLLGLTGLAAAANSQGILNAGEGSRSAGESVLRTLDPGLADRVYGQTPRERGADAKDDRNLWQRYAPKWAGGKDAPGGALGRRGRRAAEVDKTNYNFTGQNADVVRQAAKELGTTPEALATVISYETGGTFSPKKWGGKGGNYMGLIQFGPPERKQFGANENQTFAEQMPAVVRYLKTRGFKPGMGLNQLYATINGGNPYVSQNASDGNGTIASHVANMQRTHKARVERFLGSPPAGQPPVPLAPAPPQPPVIKIDPKVIPKVEQGLKSFNDRFGDSWGAGNSAGDKIAPARPLGGNISNSSNKTTNINMAPVVNTTVSGVGDAREAADVVGKTQTRVYGDLLRNLQGATA